MDIIGNTWNTGERNRMDASKNRDETFTLNILNENPLRGHEFTYNKASIELPRSEAVRLYERLGALLGMPAAPTPTLTEDQKTALTDAIRVLNYNAESPYSREMETFILDEGEQIVETLGRLRDGK